jgi:hypothetical protein
MSRWPPSIRNTKSLAGCGVRVAKGKDKLLVVAKYACRIGAA